MEALGTETTAQFIAECQQQLFLPFVSLFNFYTLQKRVHSGLHGATAQQY
jgi:hypothetical protein